MGVRAVGLATNFNSGASKEISWKALKNKRGS